MVGFKNGNLNKLLNWEVFVESFEYMQNHYRRYDAADYLYEEVSGRIKLEPLKSLLKEGKFFKLIYATLHAFNMNQRAAKLVEFNKFIEEIKSQRDKIEDLSNHKLISMNDDEIDSVLGNIKEVFFGLKIMEGQSQIVGVSKTLHFLLPDLVMPIDRKYTLNFFYGNNQYNKERSREFITFSEVFKNYCKIIRDLELTRRKFEWPVSKVIDGAIIGFMNKYVYMK